MPAGANWGARLVSSDRAPPQAVERAKQLFNERGVRSYGTFLRYVKLLTENHLNWQPKQWTRGGAPRTRRPRQRQSDFDDNRTPAQRAAAEIREQQDRYGGPTDDERQRAEAAMLQRLAGEALVARRRREDALEEEQERARRIQMHGSLEAYERYKQRSIERSLQQQRLPPAVAPPPRQLRPRPPPPPRRSARLSNRKK